LSGITPAETMGFEWQRYIHPDDLPGLLAVWQAAVRSGRDLPSYEFRFVHVDGDVRWASTTVSMVKDDHGHVTGQIAVVQDVTNRKATEEALRESENRFRHLITHAHVGITQADVDGRCVFVNRRWCDIVGVTADQVIGEGWRSYVHPEDHDRIVADWARAIAEERDMVGETRFVRPGGEVVWVSFATSGLAGPDGRPECYISTVVDVTEQRRAREVLEAEQDLLRQSIELKDRELKLIAYDIHDGLIQYAVGALMHVESLKSRSTSSADVAKIDAALDALRSTVAEGRRLINGIRTPVLDRHGIVAAIEELAREKSTAKTEVEFRASPADFGRLPAEHEIALYRMSQEALTNALKHSGSPRVEIALVRDDRWVRLMVRDWGVGMAAPAKTSRGVHGLSGIKERTHLLKGRFELDSSPETGTRIEVELPLDVAYAAKASQ
jgi:PAS domain S-box-containing protein